MQWRSGPSCNQLYCWLGIGTGSEACTLGIEQAWLAYTVGSCHQHAVAATALIVQIHAHCSLCSPPTCNHYAHVKWCQPHIGTTTLELYGRGEGGCSRLWIVLLYFSSVRCYSDVKGGDSRAGERSGFSGWHKAIQKSSASKAATGQTFLARHYWEIGAFIESINDNFANVRFQCAVTVVWI